MSRITLIRDLAGEETRYQSRDYPLIIGGPEAAIPIPEQPQAVGYIGLQQGHAFVQSADNSTELWHNDERLSGSAWLKSDDRLQIGSTLVIWQVQGERIRVSVTRAATASVPEALTPPAGPPPGSRPEPSPPMSEPGRKSGLRWGLSLAFVLLLLAALFVLASSSLVLHIQPQPTRFSLQGFPPAILLKDRALALPGNYTLHASRPGYRDLETSIEVRFRDNQRRHFRLEKQPGRLTLNSTPTPARLFVDAKAMGETPIRELALTAGPHLLRLEAPLHLPVEQELEVIGMDRLQELTLQLTPNWAEITLHSIPEGAEVREASQSLGITPLSKPLEAGEHRLELHLAGHKPHLLELQVRAGQPQVLPAIQLQEREGTVHLNSQPPGATVTVADAFQGLTPLRLTLAPGRTHPIRLAKAGYVTQTRDITLAADQEQQLEVRLPPEYGTLFVSAQPADAQLWIDGKPRGSALTRLRLTTRPHRLEIRQSGYLPFKTRITPRAGISQTIDVTLKTIETLHKSADPQTDRLTTAAGQQLKRITPTGSFTLGASRREPGRRANESLHQVRLTRPYYIGVKEITNREYRRFASGHDSGRVGSFSLDTDRQPVTNLSWDETARYLNWLSKQDNLPPAYVEEQGRMRLKRPVSTGYRLPTEAEWAYAARYAGRQDPAQYPWGARQFPPPAVQGNYGDASAQPLLPLVVDDYDDGHPASAPVGSFTPNPVGLYDMDGNLAEWCLDYYGVYTGSSRKVMEDPLGAESGRHHSVRGSSWRNASITELRLSYRDYADKPRDDLGFRIARYAK